MKATEFGEIIRNNGNYVAQDHSWSPILVPIESSYYGLSIGPICDLLLVINTNLPPILHHFQVMADYTKPPERDGRIRQYRRLAITAVCIAHCGPAVKRYKTAADRLTSDFKLVMGILVKADDDWRGVGRPQVAMHRNCHIFEFPYFSHFYTETLK